MHLQTNTGGESPESGPKIGEHIGLYLALTKARLSTLVVGTTLVGFLLGARGQAEPWLLILTLMGTALAAGGVNGLNQWLEADRDALMERTRHRPLPSGRMSPTHAFVVSYVMTAAGLVVLLVFVNALTALLAALVVAVYMFVYTPLKTRSTLNTVVGAICGALPPMMGWTAATGELATGAFVLAGILFVWQMPHFLALAWLHREDYERGGYRMLPLIDGEGLLTCSLVVLYSLALVPLALMATLIGVTGLTFAVGAIVLGAAMAAVGFGLLRRRTRRQARWVFLASLAYLPLLLGLMVVDARPIESSVVLVIEPQAAETLASPAARGLDPLER
ncbi:MAG: protoheme IX farnesyltransferase [Acidobacteriota bacterium]|nr:MAG: protoheme IX farnesyltransferase [Acidobacteriota bacterium]